jgi:Putative MetA-pathway of phenol degradation
MRKLIFARTYGLAVESSQRRFLLVAALLALPRVAGAQAIHPSPHADSATLALAGPKRRDRLLLTPAEPPPARPVDEGIVTDRPDFTESSSTVGKGRVQLEAGYTFSRDRDAGIRGSQAFPELLLRAGVLSDRLELRLGQSFTRTSVTSVEGDALSFQGADDLYVGAKLAVAAQRGWFPEVAIVVQSTLPTGAAALTAGRLLPGVNLLYGMDLGASAFTLGGSSQINGAMNDDAREYAEFAQSVTLGWDFAKTLGVYAEAFAFVPQGRSGDAVARTSYLNGGFRFKPTQNLQYDVRIGRGLTAASEDFFVGFGVSVRR